LKQLLIRTLSGIIYVTLTIGSILLGRYTFGILFAFLLIYTLFEFYRICKINGNNPQITSGIVAALYLFVAFLLYESHMFGEIVFLGLIPLLIMIAVIEIFKNKKKPAQNIAYTLLGIIYIGLPFSVLHFISTPFDATPTTYTHIYLIGLFVILWANDSGAYLLGSTMGRTKMIERISPKKTWEGAIGGAIGGTAASIIYFSFIDTVNIQQAIIIAIFTIIFGTFGDLTESLFKRSFGTKDSGTLLPGHGGLLDRFDSMLFAAPVYYTCISIILN
jgi:phosphatidate cytidylyltransferase